MTWKRKAVLVPARGPSTSFSSQIVSSPPFPAAPCLLLKTPCNQAIYSSSHNSISYRKHWENLWWKNIDATVDDAADVAAGLLDIMKDGVCVLVFHNTTIVHWLLSGCFCAQNGGNLKMGEVQQTNMWWKELLTAWSLEAWNSSISWRGNSAQTSPFITIKASGLPALIWSRKWWRPPAVPRGAYSCKYRTDTWYQDDFYTIFFACDDSCYADLLVLLVHVSNKWGHLRSRIETKQEHFLDVRNL